jgi:hypothetical protein
MGGVRENCRVIPRGALASRGTGIHVEPFDHPNLLLALKSLAQYVDWVDNVVLPVASRWIEEHRDEVTKGMTADEMNDIGAAMDKAFEIVSASDWYKAQARIGENFDVEAAMRENRVNPIWNKKTAQLIQTLNLT